MNLITNTDTLKKTVDFFSQGPFVSVDTEFHREKSFWPELCLIQLASPKTAVLIDPLAEGIDLAPFFSLMNNLNIIKVFHAARQDIEIILHLGCVIPQPLFDTQIAAMVCGYGDAVSYDKLVFQITGHILDKTSRLTDWSRRPLSKYQCTYALADVTYLCDIYLAMIEILRKNNRIDWINEEIATLCSPKLYEQNPEEAWKKVKGQIRKPREFVILQKIAAWREKKAQQRNLPRKHLIKDETLIDIAVQQPKNIKALFLLRNYPKGKEWKQSSLANELLNIITEVLAIPENELPQPKLKFADNNKNKIALLNILLKVVANKNRVSAKIIATKNEIFEIVMRKEHANVRALSGWRFKMFGRKALKMLEGQIGIKFDKDEIKLFEIQ